MSRENASKRYGGAAMQKVLGGCKLCGKPMQTNRSPLIHRTCDACKDEQLRQSNRRLAVRRKAKRHATKAALKPPRCQQCGKAIEGAPADIEWAMGAQVLRQHMQAGGV